MPDRRPFHWTSPLPDDIDPLTDRQIGTLAARLTHNPAPASVETSTVLGLLARYLKVWAAADRLLELTGHALADQRWPRDLAVAEGELHVALDTHDDL